MGTQEGLAHALFQDWTKVTVCDSVQRRSRVGTLLLHIMHFCSEH